MDVKTAFLNGLLTETIYMQQPEGFIKTGFEKYTCKLHKSLYGLKQAPRVWYDALCSFLISKGWTRLLKDRCVFIQNIDKHQCYLAVFVDDIVIMTYNMHMMYRIKEMLKQQYAMTDLGEISYILGWSIIRRRENRTIFIHQNKYALKILSKFGMLDSTPISTPSEPGITLSKSMCPTSSDDITFMSTIPYRQAVGSFMYLMMGTRPDLSFFMREVSQFLTNPGKPHWNAIKRCLKYLNGTQNYGILLGGHNVHKSLLHNSHILSAYVDSDYANCPDTRRSIGGYVTFLKSSPISLVSRKHKCVTTSTTEAEYISLCQCCQECIFLKFLLHELNFNEIHATTIHEDNQSAIKIANNPEHHGRAKHIDIRYKFLQDQIEQKAFHIEYCKTSEMIADMFTKALPRPQFEYLRSKLGVMSLCAYINP